MNNEDNVLEESFGQPFEEPYDQRMDRLLVQLNKAASKNKKKKHKDLMISLVLMALLAIGVYFGIRQTTTGGEFMHFLTDIM
ncbi:MAG: hypothetical protein ABIH23_07355 [bacterium]